MAGARFYPVIVIEDVPSDGTWAIGSLTGIPLSGLIHRVTATVDPARDVRAFDDGGNLNDIALEIREIQNPTGLGTALTGGAVVLAYGLTPLVPDETIDSLEEPPIGYRGTRNTGSTPTRDGKLYIAVQLADLLNGGGAQLGTVVVRLEIEEG